MEARRACQALGGFSFALNCLAVIAALACAVGLYKNKTVIIQTHSADRNGARTGRRYNQAPLPAYRRSPRREDHPGSRAGRSPGNSRRRHQRCLETLDQDRAT